MEQQEFHLETYLKTLWKGKWLILLTAVIAVGGVVAGRSGALPRSAQSTAYKGGTLSS
jgi:uncharacterized protein involved in exopolysaccharide biosynthesis